MYLAVVGYNENNGRDDDDDGDADGAHDNNGDVGCCPLHSHRPVGPGGVAEKMDRMKIIKRRLSMSLRSARPVDDSLSELAEQMALDEPSTARDNGETREQVHAHTVTVYTSTYFKHCSLHINLQKKLLCVLYYYILHVNTAFQVISEKTEEKAFIKGSKAECVVIIC